MTRASASFLFGTALATGVVTAIGLARSDTGMAVSVQVLDTCTVGSSAPHATQCQVEPDRHGAAAPRRAGAILSSDPNAATAGSEERANDGITTYFF